MTEKSKVLLHVEDDPDHATIVRMLIARSSFKSRVHLKHVADGKDALDYLCRRDAFIDPAVSPRPDLILLDLRMPRIDGLGVLSIVKKDPELRTIPIVVLTTSSSEKDRLEAESLGADSYLQKSVDFSTFGGTIEEICTTWL